MSIGILTFHMAHNYGAVLQCYALQEVLHHMGGDVHVIDYQQEFINNYFHPKFKFGIRSFSRNLVNGNLCSYLKDCIKPFLIYLKFSKFRNKYIRLTRKCYSIDDIPTCDIYIIGSDQPWNPFLTGGLDPVYFGEFVRHVDARLITYAVSTNIAELEKIGDEKLIRYCKNFHSLSFRESKIAEYIGCRTGRKCDVSIDPTLLAKPEIWDSILENKWKDKSYVLVYHVGGPEDVINTMTKHAEKLAERTGCQLIDASTYKYSPEEFVSLFKFAKFVVTASFHATVFSIIFHRRFYVIRTGQSSDIRFSSLLNCLSLEDLFVNADFDTIPPEYNIRDVEEKLRELRSQSLNYLSSIL